MWSVMFLCVCFRSLFRSVWRWTPVRGPQPESCFSIKLCLKCLFWNYWLHTVSSVTSVSQELISLSFRHFILCPLHEWNTMKLNTLKPFSLLASRHDPWKCFRGNDQEHGPQPGHCGKERGPNEVSLLLWFICALFLDLGFK